MHLVGNCKRDTKKYRRKINFKVDSIWNLFSVICYISIASVFYKTFSRRNHTCKSQRYTDFFEAETFPSVAIVRSRSPRCASRPHQLFRVAIPRVNFSRWQPFASPNVETCLFHLPETILGTIAFSLFCLSLLVQPQILRDRIQYHIYLRDP